MKYIIFKSLDYITFLFSSIFLLLIQINYVSANTTDFQPICSDNFKDINFKSKNEFDISLNLNEVGPCEWHRKKPSFGKYDFFSSNMIKINYIYSGSKSLKLSFSINGLDKLKRGSFIFIQKEKRDNCKVESRPYIRLGIWDGEMILETITSENKRKYNKIDFDIISDEEIFFNLVVKPEGNNKNKIFLSINDRIVNKNYGISASCGFSNIKMGLLSFGNKNRKKENIKLKFKNVSIDGSPNIRNHKKLEQVKLSYSHLLKDDNLAVCNDGTPASYYSNFELNEKSPKKIIIAFEGGGAALSLKSNATKYLEAYDRRPKRLMSSAIISYKKNSKSLNGYFKKASENGWGIIYLNYCSSDLYMGDHQLKLDGKIFEVRGRRIISSLLQKLTKTRVIRENSDLLFVGGSAGDLAISANLDIIQSLPRQRLRLLFTIWQVPSERKYVEEKQKSQFNKIIPDSALKFTHGNVAKHCMKSIVACAPNFENISRYKVDDYFIEGHWKELSGKNFAFTTRHMKDHKKFKAEIVSEINKAGGGLSLVGNKIWNSNKKYNHVLSNLNVPIGNKNIIPSDLVWNWISSNGKETRYISK